MQRTRKPRLKAPVIALLVLSACAPCLAQTTSTQTAEQSHASPAVSKGEPNAILPTAYYGPKTSKDISTQNRSSNSAGEVFGRIGNESGDRAGVGAVPAEQQDSQTLKALEIANIRLSAANDTIALLNERLKEKDAVIAALDAKDGVKTEMIDLLKSANKDRATVNNGDARMLEACNLQLSKSEARIYKLEHPGVLKSIFDVRSASGFMVGYGVRSAQNSFTK